MQPVQLCSDALIRGYMAEMNNLQLDSIAKEKEDICDKEKCQGKLRYGRYEQKFSHDMAMWGGYMYSWISLALIESHILKVSLFSNLCKRKEDICQYRRYSFFFFKYQGIPEYHACFCSKTAGNWQLCR